jgi:hypothetical protein
LLQNSPKTFRLAKQVAKQNRSPVPFAFSEFDQMHGGSGRIGGNLPQRAAKRLPA